jgi:hypothetical protein
MEIAQFLTGWIDSHVSWGFLGSCLLIYVLAKFSHGDTTVEFPSEINIRIEND